MLAGRTSFICLSALKFTIPFSVTAQFPAFFTITRKLPVQMLCGSNGTPHSSLNYTNSVHFLLEISKSTNSAQDNDYVMEHGTRCAHDTHPDYPSPDIIPSGMTTDSAAQAHGEAGKPNPNTTPTRRNGVRRNQEMRHSRETQWTAPR